MQRFINNPDFVVDDTVRGFVKAHGDLVKLADNPKVVAYAQAPIRGKVGVITGGGSGHEPAFIGYVGRNMLDAVAMGEIFSSPTAKSFHDAMKIADGGRGVVCLYGNYAGDNMNVKMAVKLAAKEGLEVLTVVANDDVCSAPLSEREKRRGVAGEILMWKVGAAKAALGGSAREVQAVAQKAIDNCRSIGVGLGPCTLPAVGHPNFTIEAGKMEVGIGHHGEPGTRVEPLKTAAEVARDMVKVVLDDHNLPSGTEVAVLISGLGATPTNELYILHDTIDEEVRGRGLKIARTYIGNFFTSLEMVGATLTIMALDGELKELLAVDVACPAPLVRNAAMQAFSNAGSGDIVLAIAQRIVEERAYLSDIDGLIGDGDHGVNMAKGFSLAAERLRGEPRPLAASLATLGDVLMTEIGGSMGPLYGVMFSGFAEALDGVEAIDAAAFERMLAQRSGGGPVDRRRQGRRQDADRRLRAGAAGVLRRHGQGRKLCHGARCADRRRRKGARQHDRPGRQDRSGEPARRTFAWRARSRRDVVRDHPANACRGREGQAG